MKSRFPQFFVKVGIYAQVDTPERARFWQELGADADSAAVATLVWLMVKLGISELGREAFDSKLGLHPVSRDAVAERSGNR